MPRQSAVALRAMAGQAERRIPRSGCEVTDFIRREELLCNVKCSPYGNRFRRRVAPCKVTLEGAVSHGQGASMPRNGSANRNR